MIDAAADSSNLDATPQAAIDAVTDHRLMGYCAGCGTWDAHGVVCISCGYDFTADAGSDSSV